MCISHRTKEYFTVYGFCSWTDDWTCWFCDNNLSRFRTFAPSQWQNNDILTISFHYKDFFSNNLMRKLHLFIVHFIFFPKRQSAASSPSAAHVCIFFMFILKLHRFYGQKQKPSSCFPVVTHKAQKLNIFHLSRKDDSGAED